MNRKDRRSLEVLEAVRALEEIVMAEEPEDWGQELEGEAVSPPKDGRRSCKDTKTVGCRGNQKDNI